MLCVEIDVDCIGEVLYYVLVFVLLEFDEVVLVVDLYYVVVMVVVVVYYF